MSNDYDSPNESERAFWSIGVEEADEQAPTEAVEAAGVVLGEDPGDGRESPQGPTEAVSEKAQDVEVKGPRILHYEVAPGVWMDKAVK